jgi:hypothetical protein
MRALYEYIRITEVYSTEERPVQQSGSIIGERLEEDVLRGRALQLRQKTSKPKKIINQKWIPFGDNASN